MQTSSPSEQEEVEENPNPRYKMPISRCQTQGFAGGNAWSTPLASEEPQQQYNTAENMRGMYARQHVKEGAMGAGRQEYPHRTEIPPCGDLSHYEREAQGHAGKNPRAE